MIIHCILSVTKKIEKNKARMISALIFQIQRGKIVSTVSYKELMLYSQVLPKISHLQLHKNLEKVIFPKYIPLYDKTPLSCLATFTVSLMDDFHFRQIPNDECIVTRVPKFDAYRSENFS